MLGGLDATWEGKVVGKCVFTRNCVRLFSKNLGREGIGGIMC